MVVKPRNDLQEIIELLSHTARAIIRLIEHEIRDYELVFFSYELLLSDEQYSR